MKKTPKGCMQPDCVQSFYKNSLCFEVILKMGDFSYLKWIKYLLVKVFSLPVRLWSNDACNFSGYFLIEYYYFFSTHMTSLLNGNGSTAMFVQVTIGILCVSNCLTCCFQNQHANTFSSNNPHLKTHNFVPPQSGKN